MSKRAGRKERYLPAFLLGEIFYAFAGRGIFPAMALSLLYFFLAGLCEIGGGYLIWLWLREGRSVWFAVAGALLLVAYGVIPTFQPTHFGRTYAAYGGIFIIMSILWAAYVDGTLPDRYDIIGAVLVIVGVLIMMYMPRGTGG